MTDVEINENYFVMIGKSFEVKNYKELENKLKPFNLTLNFNHVNDQTATSVRRKNDPQGNPRYELKIQGCDSYSYPQDGFSVPTHICIGKTIAQDPKRQGSGITKLSLSKIEETFNEIKQDISDATLMLFSQTHYHYPRSTHP